MLRDLPTWVSSTVCQLDRRHSRLINLTRHRLGTAALCEDGDVPPGNNSLVGSAVHGHHGAALRFSQSSFFVFAARCPTSWVFDFSEKKETFPPVCWIV